MTRPWLALALVASLGGAVVACSTTSGSTDPWIGYGPNPDLPAPQKSLLPTVKIAEVKGWGAGEAPAAPAGFTVTRFAEGLDHPRWFLVLPNGDVLVAESSSESKPPKGIRGFFQNLLMKKSGGAQTKSPDRVMLLRDANGDGVAELKTVFAPSIRRPFGMTLVGNTLYIARDDGVVRFPYSAGQTSVQGPGERVFDLPAGRNHHWTKSLIASRDGAKLYAAVGSNSNVAENGMEEEVGRAAIHEYDIASGKLRLFASGLRNPNGLAWEPTTGALWTTVNERDEIGNDLVPDYMTSVRDGGFYGWPYSYYGGRVDERVKPQRPELVAKAIAPDYALGPHTASLGLAFYTAAAFPAPYQGGAFVGQHGSWNRKPLNGYQVVFVPFAGGRPQMPPQAFLTGFLDADGKVRGRPVGVAVDARGGLLVADDVGEIVWRVAPAGPAPTPAAAAVSPS
jgi:glucose/arabinose dehydrogenase